jgi:DNA repair protein RadA/Sms
VAEAEKLGFDQIIVSKYNKKGFAAEAKGIKVTALGKVEELYDLLFRD